MSGWRARSLTIVATAAAAGLAGCSQGRQDVNEPTGKFPVAITRATFPTSQRLSQHVHMVVTVRNIGHRTIPDLAITVCNVSCQQPAQSGEASGTQAFAEISNQPDLANPSRPIWIVDRPPGQCGYSCRSGGPGSDVTAYTNTWAAGGVQPGRSVTFDFGVTAVAAGRHVVSFEIAAGLNGKAKAVLANGALPSRRFQVMVTNQPRQSYVNDAGQVVIGRQSP